MNSRGDVSLIVLLAVVVLGGGAWGLSKTKWFSRESKRAETSTETTEELIAAKDQQSAEAAASVTKIVEANSTAPESWQKEFIGMEGSLALGFLRKPDPMALVRAEARLRAVAEGERDEARRLYGLEQNRAVDAEKRAERAIAAKRASDLALEQAAAEARGAEQNQFWLGLVAIAAAGLYLWVKITHLSPGSLARVVGDIRSGTAETNPALAAIDTHTGQLQQWATRGNVWLNGKIEKLFS